MSDKVTVSACLVVKDEAYTISKTIGSICDYVDEICVVDTGSGDNTIQKIKDVLDLCCPRTPLMVRTVPWAEDFSVHRNQSFAMASGDWIFVIDGDERLVGEPDLIRVNAAEAEAQGVTCVLGRVENELRPGETSIVSIPRLFKAGVRCANPVHNVYIPLPGNTGSGGYHIYHVGYSRAMPFYRAKQERRERMMRSWVEREPHNPEAAFYLSSLLCVKSPVEANEIAMGAINSLLNGDNKDYPSGNTILPSLYYVATVAQTQQQLWGDAYETSRKGIDLCPDHPDLYLLNADAARKCFDIKGSLLMMEEFLRVQAEFLKDPTRFPYIEHHNASARQRVMLGCAIECLTLVNEDEDFFNLGQKLLMQYINEYGVTSDQWRAAQEHGQG